MSNDPDFIVDSSGNVRDVRRLTTSPDFVHESSRNVKDIASQKTSFETKSKSLQPTRLGYPDSDTYRRDYKQSKRRTRDYTDFLVIPSALLISFILYFIFRLPGCSSRQNPGFEQIGVSSGRNTYSESAVNYLKMGIDSYSKGDYDNAIEYFNSALRLDPKMPEAFNNLGLAYDAKGQRDQALANLDQAIQLAPDYATPYCNRGAINYDLGDIKEAIADLDKAIVLFPHFGKAYYNRGLTKMKIGNYDSAISDFSNAIEYANEFPPSFFNIPESTAFSIPESTMESLLSTKENSILSELFRIGSDNELMSAQISVNLPYAYVNRSLAYFLKGDKKNAYADLEKAEQLGLEPDIAQELKERNKVPVLEWTPHITGDESTKIPATKTGTP
jgi:tetratricopeptide (TPR) repeat protein